MIDIYPLENNSDRFGLGAIGELNKKQNLKEFCSLVSEKLGTDNLRIAVKDDKIKIGKVAVCGGSGSSMWKFAYNAGAEVILTSEFNHHLYQEASYYINVIDATHHSTEQFTIDGLYESTPCKLSDSLHMNIIELAVQKAKLTLEENNISNRIQSGIVTSRDK